MKNMIYEKPAMRKVDLRSNRNIADTCWGYAASGSESDLYYYEVSNSAYGGTNTYIGFRVSGGGSCKSVSNIEYLVYEYGSGLDTEEKKAGARKELEAYLSGTVGADSNGGSPFNNGYKLDTTPGRSW